MFLLAHLGIALAASVAAERATRVGLDARLVLLGGILPDLIDKPLALAGFGDGRSVAHTAAFTALLVLVPSGIAARPVPWPGLPFGVGVHLVLDGMWAQPERLLWPAYGLGFPAGLSGPSAFWEALFTDPLVQAGEVLGGLALAAFAVRHRLYERGAFLRFWRRGLPGADAEGGSPGGCAVLGNEVVARPDVRRSSRRGVPSADRNLLGRPARCPAVAERRRRFAAFIGWSPRSPLAFLLFLVSALSLLMAVLVLLGYAGVRVEGLRRLWTPWPPDAVKAVAGFAAFSALVWWRSRALRSGPAAEVGEAGAAEAEEATVPGGEAPAAVGGGAVPPEAEVEAPVAAERPPEAGAGTEPATAGVGEEPRGSVSEEEVDRLLEEVQEEAAVRTPRDAEAEERLLAELESAIAGGKAPPPPLRPEVPEEAMDRKREMLEFLVSLPGVSRRAAESVSAFFPDLEQLGEADGETLRAIRGVSPEEAQQILRAVRSRPGRAKS